MYRTLKIIAVIAFIGFVIVAQATSSSIIWTNTTTITTYTNQSITTYTNADQNPTPEPTMSNNSFWINAQAYGATGDNITDDTAAIQSAVATINSMSSGTLYFPPKTYKVTGVNNSILFNFSNVNGLTINGAGAVIRDSKAYSGSENATIFMFTNVTNANINLKVAGQHFTTDRVGFDAFSFQHGSSNINANVQVDGGIRSFYLYRLSTDPASWKLHDVNVKLDASYSEYGCFADRGVYNFFCQENATHVNRGFFLIGVDNGVINIHEQDPQGASEIAVYGGVNSSDIDVTLIDTTSTIAVAANYLLALQFSDQTPGMLKNIKIKLDTVNPPSAPWHDTIRLLKIENSGNFDNIGRGHVLDGLEITGSDTQYNNREHFISYGTWTAPDIQKNINIHDLNLNNGLQATGSDFLINLGALVGYANFRNIYAPYALITASNGNNGNVLFENTYALGATSAPDRQTYINSKFISNCATTTINKQILFSNICGTNYQIMG